MGWRDGVGQSIYLNWPIGLMVTRNSARIYVADAGNNRIRMIDTATRTVTTIVGSGEPRDGDGVDLSASINGPQYMTFDWSSSEPESRVYVTTVEGIRCLTLSAGTCQLILNPRGGKRGRE
jgi:YVTN family beta-propeller protein